jgi:hypothetical protein
MQNLSTGVMQIMARSETTGDADSRVRRKFSYVYGLFLLLIGIIFILVSLHWDVSSETSSTQHTLLTLLQTLGVTTFGVGILNIVIEMKDWRSYFEERVKNVIIEQSFLERLDSDTLHAIQTNVLKAFFKDKTIDREGSFLDYFHSNLHKFIAEPYREDVTSEIICESYHKDKNTWKIYECLTYICRKSAGSIQPEVRWGPDRYEKITVESVTITIRYPFNHEQMGEEKVLRSKERNDNLQNIVSESLVPYNIDGLIVIIEAEYLISKDRFQYWQMSHSTKNLEIVITCPKEYDIQFLPLVLHEELVLITQKSRYLRMKYDSWMLPQSGIAWRFVPMKSGCAPISSESENPPHEVANVTETTTHKPRI